VHLFADTDVSLWDTVVELRSACRNAFVRFQSFSLFTKQILRNHMLTYYGMALNTKELRRITFLPIRGNLSVL
jgi:hypothetical protein